LSPVVVAFNLLLLIVNIERKRKDEKNFTIRKEWSTKKKQESLIA